MDCRKVRDHKEFDFFSIGLLDATNFEKVENSTFMITALDSVIGENIREFLYFKASKLDTCRTKLNILIL